SLGYVAQFPRAGAQAISLMSLTGDSAVASDGNGSSFARYPSYFVLQRLRGPARMREVVVSDPTRIVALALWRHDRDELLLANLTGNTVEVVLDGRTASSDVSIIDAESWDSFCSLDDPWKAMRQKASTSRHRLGAYAIMSCETPTQR